MVSDIDSERAIQVVKEITAIRSKLEVQIVPADADSWKQACSAADLIVQSTPLGMKRDDPSLLGPNAFHKGQMLFDLIYMYPETRLMNAARQSGAQTANGLGMLLHQGAKAFSIWTGQEPDLEAMRKALEAEVYTQAVSSIIPERRSRASTS
jgi:shikimate 5-dehydrogenase